MRNKYQKFGDCEFLYYLFAKSNVHVLLENKTTLYAPRSALQLTLKDIALNKKYIQSNDIYTTEDCPYGNKYYRDYKSINAE